MKVKSSCSNIFSYLIATPPSTNIHTHILTSRDPLTPWRGKLLSIPQRVRMSPCALDQVSKQIEASVGVPPYVKKQRYNIHTHDIQGIRTKRTTNKV